MFPPTPLSFTAPTEYPLSLSCRYRVAASARVSARCAAIVRLLCVVCYSMSPCRSVLPLLSLAPLSSEASLVRLLVGLAASCGRRSSVGTNHRPCVSFALHYAAFCCVFVLALIRLPTRLARHRATRPKNCSSPSVAHLLCPPCVSLRFVSFRLVFRIRASRVPPPGGSAALFPPTALATRSAINIIRWFVRRLARAAGGGLRGRAPAAINTFVYSSAPLPRVCPSPPPIPPCECAFCHLCPAVISVWLLLSRRAPVCRLR